MKKQSLVSVWKVYVDKAQKHSGTTAGGFEDDDIDHLKSIDACSELIAAAGYLSAFDDIYWAPNEELRKYAPDYFPNSLIIGDDGCGNHMCWLDVRNANSKILFLCHDPAIIMVIANTATEWIEGLIGGYNSPTFDEKGETSWGVFYEASGLEKSEKKIWREKINNGENDDFGLVKWQKSGLSYFDFNNAHPGAGVSLDYNGKHTCIETGDQTGILALGVLSKETIKSQRRADVIIYFLMAICFAGCFYFFNQVDGKGVIASFFSSMVVTLLLFIISGTVYGIKDRFNAKK